MCKCRFCCHSTTQQEDQVFLHHRVRCRSDATQQNRQVDHQNVGYEKVSSIACEGGGEQASVAFVATASARLWPLVWHSQYSFVALCRWDPRLLQYHQRRASADECCWFNAHASVYSEMRQFLEVLQRPPCFQVALFLSHRRKSGFPWKPALLLDLC